MVCEIKDIKKNSLDKIYEIMNEKNLFNQVDNKFYYSNKYELEESLNSVNEWINSNFKLNKNWYVIDDEKVEFNFPPNLEIAYQYKNKNIIKNKKYNLFINYLKNKSIPDGVIETKNNRPVLIEPVNVIDNHLSIDNDYVEIDYITKSKLLSKRKFIYLDSPENQELWNKFNANSTYTPKLPINSRTINNLQLENNQIIDLNINSEIIINGNTLLNILLENNESVIDDSNDFTINNLSYNPVTKTLTDNNPDLQGIKDLKNKIIRYRFDTDENEVVDKALLLQNKTGFNIDKETLNFISKSNIQPETWVKWANEGQYHSLIFEFIRNTNLDIEYFKNLNHVKLDPVLFELENLEDYIKYQLDNLENKNDFDILYVLLKDLGKQDVVEDRWFNQFNRHITIHPNQEFESVNIANEFLSNLSIKDEDKSKLINKIKSQYDYLNEISDVKTNKVISHLKVNYYNDIKEWIYNQIKANKDILVSNLENKLKGEIEANIPNDLDYILNERPTIKSIDDIPYDNLETKINFKEVLNERFIDIEYKKSMNPYLIRMNGLYNNKGYYDSKDVVKSEWDLIESLNLNLFDNIKYQTRLEYILNVVNNKNIPIIHEDYVYLKIGKLKYPITKINGVWESALNLNGLEQDTAIDKIIKKLDTDIDSTLPKIEVENPYITLNTYLYELMQYNELKQDVIESIVKPINYTVKKQTEIIDTTSPVFIYTNQEVQQLDRNNRVIYYNKKSDLNKLYDYYSKPIKISFYNKIEPNENKVYITINNKDNEHNINVYEKDAETYDYSLKGIDLNSIDEIDINNAKYANKYIGKNKSYNIQYRKNREFNKEDVVWIEEGEISEIPNVYITDNKKIQKQLIEKGYKKNYVNETNFYIREDNYKKTTFEDFKKEVDKLKTEVYDTNKEIALPNNLNLDTQMSEYLISTFTTINKGFEKNDVNTIGNLLYSGNKLFLEPFKDNLKRLLNIEELSDEKFNQFNNLSELEKDAIYNHYKNNKVKFKPIINYTEIDGKIRIGNVGTALMDKNKLLKIENLNIPEDEFIKHLSQSPSLQSYDTLITPNGNYSINNKLPVNSINRKDVKINKKEIQPKVNSKEIKEKDVKQSNINLSKFIKKYFSKFSTEEIEAVYLESGTLNDLDFISWYNSLLDSIKEDLPILEPYNIMYSPTNIGVIIKNRCVNNEMS